MAKDEVFVEADGESVRVSSPGKVMFPEQGWTKLDVAEHYLRCGPGIVAAVRRAAVAFAREVERRTPAVATTAWWKEERHGVFLDFNQHARDKTIASAYSVRETGRVSAPLRWDELDSIDPLALDLPGFAARWEAAGDLAAGMDAASGRFDACSRSPTRTTSAASPTCRGRRTTRNSRTSRRASHHRGAARTQPGRPPRRRVPRTPRPAVPAAFPSATPI